MKYWPKVIGNIVLTFSDWKVFFDKSGSEARSLPATVISEATPLNLRATKGSPGDGMAARDWSNISLETNQMAAASFERTSLLELVGPTLFQGQSEQNWCSERFFSFSIIHSVVFCSRFLLHHYLSKNKNTNSSNGNQQWTSTELYSTPIRKWLFCFNALLVNFMFCT